MDVINFLIHEDQLFTTITLAILIALLVGNILSDKFKKYIDVDAQGAVALMDNKDLTILDVREKKERAAGFIAKDKHIPLAQVKSKLSELDADKKILVYCRSGGRSSHIAGLLSKNGFAEVYNLKGGFQAWQKANLPIKI